MQQMIENDSYSQLLKTWKKGFVVAIIDVGLKIICYRSDRKDFTLLHDPLA